MPDLHDVLVERVYTWLVRKTKSSSSNRMRTSGLMTALMRDISPDRIGVRVALRSLRETGSVSYKSDISGEPLDGGMIEVIPPVKDEPQTLTNWKAALSLEGDVLSDVDALLPLHAVFAGASVEQMRAFFSGLRRLRHEQAAWYGRPSFMVSAEFLCGSAKALSMFDKAALRAFGIEVSQFPTRPPYIVMGGNCESSEAVVLVENPVAFETAVQSKAGERCAFLCTFGHGLSISASEHGNQLATVIEGSTGIPLYRNTASRRPLQEILGSQRIFFWGDLDMEGLRIFERIKNRLQLLELSALYEPMINSIRNPMSRHEYLSLTGKIGQRPFKAVTQSGKLIMPMCTKYAVDQETVSTQDIDSLAGNGLNLDSFL